MRLTLRKSCNGVDVCAGGVGGWVGKKLCSKGEVCRRRIYFEITKNVFTKQDCRVGCYWCYRGRRGTVLQVLGSLGASCSSELHVHASHNMHHTRCDAHFLPLGLGLWGWFHDHSTADVCNGVVG